MKLKSFRTTTLVKKKIMNSASPIYSDLIAKMLQLEKSLFDGGASPHDIAMVVSMAAKGGSIAPITPGTVESHLM